MPKCIFVNTEDCITQAGGGITNLHVHIIFRTEEGERVKNSDVKITNLKRGPKTVVYLCSRKTIRHARKKTISFAKTMRRKGRFAGTKMATETTEDTRGGVNEEASQNIFTNRKAFLPER